MSPALQLSASGRGTAVAQTLTQMKFAMNRNEVALLGQQELPDAPVDSADDALPINRAPWRTGLALRRLPPSGAAVRSPMLDNLDAPIPAAHSPAPQPGSIRESTPDRLFRQIDAEVKLINSSKADSLSVLLKPDPGTEILLHLRLREGQVEAQARCQRGDFQALNSDWGQLQERLSGCGVRLSPLTLPAGSGSEWQRSGSDSFGASTQFQNHRQPQSQPEYPEEPTSSAPAQWWPSLRARWRRSAACRLLESWA